MYLLILHVLFSDYNFGIHDCMNASHASGAKFTPLHCWGVTQLNKFLCCCTCGIQSTYSSSQSCIFCTCLSAWHLEHNLGHRILPAASPSTRLVVIKLKTEDTLKKIAWICHWVELHLLTVRKSFTNLKELNFVSVSVSFVSNVDVTYKPYPDSPGFSFFMLLGGQI